MTKELKDMNREEITDLFGEKHKELKKLIEKIKEETEFEQLSNIIIATKLRKAIMGDEDDE